MGDILLQPPRDDVYGDPGVHALSVTYFENIKSSPQAHRICMDMLTSGSSLDDRVKTVCLTVIAEYILEQYPEDSTATDQGELRTFLTNYAEVQLCGRRNQRLEEQQVRNIAADIYCRVCLNDYPRRWPAFFRRLFVMVDMGPKAVDHYLRTLSFISCTVSGPAFSKETYERNDRIRKSIQAVDIERILNSWCVILSGYSIAIKVECLRVILEFLTWVDPIHFMEHPIIPVLSFEIDYDDTRSLVLDCFYEIVKNLAMTHSCSKRFMGEVFHIIILARNWAAPDPDKETLFVRVGELISAIGINLLLIYNKIPTSNETYNYPIDFSTLFPYILDFLECKNTNISASVISCVSNFVSFLQSRTKLLREEYNNYRKLLATLLRRMRMKSTYEFQDTDKEAADDSFTVYRNTLVLLFEDVVTVKKKVVFKGVNQVVLKYFVERDWAQEPFYLAEYPVFLFNLLSTVSSMDFDLVQQRMTRTIMRAVLTCGIMSHPHPLVTVQLFRAMGINCRFFRSESIFIPKVLSFFFTRGIESSSGKLKTLAAKQLLNFLKGLRIDLMDSFATVISSIRKVTVSTSEVGEEPRGPERISREAQLYLYEAMGIAIAEGKFANQSKRHYMAEVIVPAMHVFHQSCHAWITSRDQKTSAEGICHAVDIVSHLARGFDERTATLSGCDDVFLDTLTILDHCPMAQMMRADIHAAMLQLIHQMMRCLGHKFLPFVSTMFKNLVHCRESDNVIECGKVVTTAVTRYGRKLFLLFKREFHRIGSYFFDTLTRPALTLTVKKYNRPKLDERQECYVTFVMEFVKNDMLIEILDVQDERSLIRQVTMIAAAALEGSSREWKTKGFIILKHIVEKWRPLNVSTETIYFIYNFMVKICFLGFKDAICTLGITIEDFEDTYNICTEIILKVYERRGEEMLTWMEEDFLPQIKISSSKIDELIQTLRGDPYITLEDCIKSIFLDNTDTLQFHPLPLLPSNIF